MDTPPTPSDLAETSPEPPSTCPERGSHRSPGWPILGALLLVATVVWAHRVEGGLLEQLVNPIDFLLVAGVCASAVLIGCGFRAPLKQLGALLGGRAHDLTALRRALQLVIVVGPLSGFLGTVYGLIQVMQNLPNLQIVGALLASSLVPLLYGLVVALVAYGLEVLARRRSLEVPPDREGPGEGRSGRPIIATSLLITSIASAHVLEGAPW